MSHERLISQNRTSISNKSEALFLSQLTRPYLPILLSPDEHGYHLLYGLNGSFPLTFVRNFSLQLRIGFLLNLASEITKSGIISFPITSKNIRVGSDFSPVIIYRDIYHDQVNQCEQFRHLILELLESEKPEPLIEEFFLTSANINSVNELAQALIKLEDLLNNKRKKYQQTKKIYWRLSLLIILLIIIISCFL